MIKTKDEIINGLCLTYRHDYHLLKAPDDSSVSSGMTHTEQIGLYRDMEQLYEHNIAELHQAAIRYEKLRKLNPNQFGDLFDRNLHGEGTFDELVDML